MKDGGHPIALFNGPIITSNGLFRVGDISVEEAKALVEKNGFISAIGHEAAASVLSAVLGVRAVMNRIQFHQAVGQKAVALKLRQRPPEGIVLDEDEMQIIGYSLKLIERLE